MEYEKIDTQATVQEIGRVGWDALGGHILIETLQGQTPEKTFSSFLALTPQAALTLLLSLDACLEEKEGGEGAAQ